MSQLQADEVAPYLFGADYTLLAGCAPCQPFSSYSQGGRAKGAKSAAKGENLDWRLVASFGRLVRDLKPDFVTMENVSQLSAHPVYDEFVESLDGYKIWQQVVECASIGVPQSRKRLVLLASRLGEVKLNTTKYARSAMTVRKTIAKLPRIAAGGQDANDPLHVAASLSERNLERIRASKPGGTWRDWPVDLQANCHRKESGATYPSVYGRMEWDKVAPTITTQSFGYGNGRFGHPEQDRAISLREAAMLQTFPREYRFLEPGSKPHFSRLGRLIGNAVPVRLGEVIAETLIDHISTLSGERRSK